MARNGFNTSGNSSSGFAEILNPLGKFARELRESILVLDTETTGLAEYDEVIELAVVKASNGEVVIDELFNPMVDISPGAAKVHGYTNAALKDKPFFVDRWQGLREQLEGRIIGAWNAEFDKNILAQTCKRYGLAEVQVEWVCLMELYQQFKGLSVRCKLEYACKAMGVKAGDHSAVNDSLAAARVLWRIAESKPEVDLIGDTKAQRVNNSEDYDPGYDTDDNCIVSVEEFLTSHKWRERKTLKSGKIVSLWTDPQTGATFQTNAALEIQRQR